MEEAPRPRASFEFEVEKIVGVSSDGQYQVQWAPSWISKSLLIGCDHLIHEFLQQEYDTVSDNPSDVTTSETNDNKELIEELLTQPFGMKIKDESENQFDKPAPCLVKDVLQQPSEMEVNAERENEFEGSRVTIEKEDNHYRKRVDIEEDSNEKTPLPPLAEVKETGSDLDYPLNHPIEHLGIEGDSEDLENNHGQLLSETSKISSTDVDIDKAVNDLRSFEPISTQSSEMRIKDEPENQFHKPTLGLVKDVLQQPSEMEVNVEREKEFEESVTIEKEDNPYRKREDIEEESNEETPLPPLTKVKETGSGLDYPLNHPVEHLGVVGDSEDFENNHGQLLSETSSNISSTDVDMDEAVNDLRSFEPHDCIFGETKTTDKLARAQSDTPLSEVQLYNIEFADEIDTMPKPTCSVCSEEFLDIKQLVTHLKVHTELTSFVCPYCQRKVSQRHNLISHARIHTGELPYFCKHCEYRCRTKRQLTVHVRSHTGEKPYACEICKKMFSTKQNLENHTRTHTGERPYICDECEKSFATKQSCESHILNAHTGVITYCCKSCSRKFSNLTMRNQHMSRCSNKKKQNKF